MTEKTNSSIGQAHKSQLTPQLLRSAYGQGYFPMPEEETGEIFWYRPDPRAIIPIDQFHVSRSLRRILQRQIFQVTFHQDFEGVMDACAHREVTWINAEIKSAFLELAQVGCAKSVEVWFEGDLVGGVYGACFGGAFFAESMFHRKTDASKVALYYLTEKLKERNFALLECQFMTSHLRSLGAVEISDHEYKTILGAAIKKDVYFA